MKRQGKGKTAPSDPKAYAMTVKLEAPGLLDVMPVEELEKVVHLVRARYIYAATQKAKWANEEYTRSAEFNAALLAQARRVHGITEEQLRDEPKAHFWTYAK